MGLASFGLGMCAGFYFRNTAFGRKLTNRILVAKKLIKDTNFSEYKLVLVVRDDLNMSKGKIASQCSHASVLAYQNALMSNPEITNMWESFGQSKIILRVPNGVKLLDLSNQAKKLGLFTNIVADAGRTEVSPGTKTVLAIGPGPKEIIDNVTAHLKLL